MMNTIPAPFVSRLTGAPLAVATGFLPAMMSDLSCLATVDHAKEIAASIAARPTMLAALGLPFQTADSQKPFAFSQGVAVIPVSGMLLNRFGQSYGSYATGYNFIRSQMNAALADDDVQGIVFDVNSYGGEVAGMGELVDDIYNARSQKPSMAMVDSNAYSAAYGIASAAGRTVVTPSGGAGSIGAIMVHTSYAGALEQGGVKVTPIISGSHKADGNPYQDLPDDVFEGMQAQVDGSRMAFASQVARNRGLGLQAVLGTEALTYSATDAQKLGLIDAVQPASQAMTAFLSELSRSNSKETTMTVPSAGAEALQASQAQLQQEARTSERQRIAAIQALPEAKDRSQLANHLALQTEMSVDAAKGILAASPIEGAAAAAQSTSPFANAMDHSKNPEVGADVGVPLAGRQQSHSQGILAAHRAATGRKPTRP